VASVLQVGHLVAGGVDVVVVVKVFSERVRDRERPRR
jgi:hypothetical protein